MTTLPPSNLKRQVLSFMANGLQAVAQPPSATATSTTVPPVPPANSHANFEQEQKNTADAFFEKLTTVPGLGTAARQLLPRLFVTYALMVDRDTPMWAKGVAAGALAYFVMPIDVIPDGIVGVGFLDDLVAVCIAFDCLTNLITPKVRREGIRMYEESTIKRRLGL